MRLPTLILLLLLTLLHPSTATKSKPKSKSKAIEYTTSYPPAIPPAFKVQGAPPPHPITQPRIIPHTSSQPSYPVAKPLPSIDLPPLPPLAFPHPPTFNRNDNVQWSLAALVTTACATTLAPGVS
ncbi:hypothetical protein MMC30_009290 [Trapelia coarctata]|nr:hypothetical protein [Trapelia coarctata]